jgi:twinkle protein
MSKEPSHFLFHVPCGECGSSDANSLYSDNHQHCFACDNHVAADGNTPQQQTTTRRSMGLISGEYQDLIRRGIKEETCRFFGYQVGMARKKGQDEESKVQIAPYFNAAGEMVAQKIRFADKNFSIFGDLKESTGFFGSRHWGGGKKIVITEGEIDCMTVSQMQSNKWPVISVPNGAQGAAKAIKEHLQYFDAFEEVILMFDMDEPGTKAAQECAGLFAPGKCKIASLSMKDPNELLMAGNGEQIVSAIWQAKAFRPDGLVGVSDLMEELNKDIEQGLPWFLPSLTKLTFGRRHGEIYGLGAGTGIGKTDVFTQQIAFDIETLGERVGLVFLEQQPTETVTRVAGKLAGKRFHVPDGTWTKEERNEWVLKLDGKVTLYDNFGETEWSVVASKIRYMAVSEGIRIFYIDHLTAMADTADERGSLEQIMKEMASLAKALKVIIHFISHLATPDGKSHEEGGHVSMRHFKGARAIGFWTHFAFGLERNQQSEDAQERQTTTLRVLKDRYTGQSTGQLIYLGYDTTTGLLFETVMPAEQKPFETTDF